MIEHVLPSGLAELEQLHAEPNSQQLVSLHHSSTHCKRQKAGWGLETRLRYMWVESSGLVVLEQLHVESKKGNVVNISVPYSQSHTIYTLANTCQATPTNKRCMREAWCGYWYGWVSKTLWWCSQNLCVPEYSNILISHDCKWPPNSW